MFTIKIIANSNLEALETVDRLIPQSKIKELRVDNSYQITNEKVYTITVHHVDKKA